jgi:hypothetical protein
MSEHLTVPFEFTHSNYLRKCSTIQEFANICADWGANEERKRIHNMIMKILSSDISFDSKINFLKLVKEMDSLIVSNILDSITLDNSASDWKALINWKYNHFFFLDSSQTACGIIASKKSKYLKDSSSLQCPRCKKIVNKVLITTSSNKC